MFTISRACVNEFIFINTEYLVEYVVTAAVVYPYLMGIYIYSNS